MRENSHYRHCGTEGRCVSDNNDCTCKCWHCGRVKAERRRMLNESDRKIHAFHRLPEEREGCAYCSRLDEEALEAKREKVHIRGGGEPVKVEA